MNKIYYLSTCTTSLRIFKETGIMQKQDKFILQDIKVEKITPKQLDEMKTLTGSYEALFSRRAIKYKEWDLRSKDLSEDDYRKYILEEYTFLKRPVVIINNKIFAGSEKNTVATLKKEVNSI
ncbi:MAG: ArsC/Spx/MgsR family protein [Bacteroidota bacterium]